MIKKTWKTKGANHNDFAKNGENDDTENRFL